MSETGPGEFETSREEFEQYVSRTPFLAGLEARHLHLLAACAKRTHFAAGQLIFRQGETANRFYLIQSGRVQLEAVSQTGGPSVAVETIGSGDLVGWSWLFEPFEWQFSARALSEAEAIFFYGTLLREYCEADPALGYELLKRMTAVMMKRLQSARRLLVGVKSGYSSIGAEHPIANAA